MLLPEEINDLQFEVAFRGYNTREVDEFLSKLRSDLTDIAKEQESLRKKIAAAELLAKDAKDHEEEFVASMSADRDAAASILESSKAEGERILREAKNAATGIMAEVRRRASEISKESRKVAAETVDEALRSAAEIKESAEKAAEEKLFSVRTESENIIKAAAAQAKAITDEATKNSEIILDNAKNYAALCEEYMNELRSAADSICRELDIELKNSAARISLLAKRVAGMESVTPPEFDPVEEKITESPSVNNGTYTESVSSAPTESTEIPSSAETKDEPAHEKISSTNNDKDKPKTAKKAGGYFTEEYRQVMEELFGEDVSISESAMPEDDDTYDYLDMVSVVSSAKNESVSDGDEDTVSEDEESLTVTSEYKGIPANSDEDLLDVFSSSTLDRVYKSPSEDDINNILKDF